MTARCLVDVSSPSQSDAATGWSTTVTGLISWSEASDEVIANTDTDNNALSWSYVQKCILRLFSWAEVSDEVIANTDNNAVFWSYVKSKKMYF